MASSVEGLQSCHRLDKQVEVRTLKLYLHKLSLKEQSYFPEVDLVIGLYVLACLLSLTLYSSCSLLQRGSVLLARFQSSFWPVAKSHYKVHKGLNLF